jgi:NAD(P)-dependent dehydrogenase (short-subunit alcohol dehydrogenase family)
VCERPCSCVSGRACGVHVFPPCLQTRLDGDASSMQHLARPMMKQKSGSIGIPNACSHLNPTSLVMYHPSGERGATLTSEIGPDVAGRHGPVFCSSAVASIGLPNHEAIAAAKGAVEGLALSAGRPLSWHPYSIPYCCQYLFLIYRHDRCIP